MATKEEALEGFLKSLRIALNFILLYSKDHKSFLKSVSDLKQKTDELFAFLDPIEIVFGPDFLSVEGVVYAKMALHKDLAGLFHQRKVKSVKLTRGVTEEQLAGLLEKSSLSPQEIIRAGGLSMILGESFKSAGFTVTDLDYSQLLKSEGEEVKYGWSFMISKAVAQDDSKLIDEFADNFEMMVLKFKARDLIQDKELKTRLHKFLEYLKKSNREKFLNCSRAMLKLIIKDKSILSEEGNIESLRSFLADLDPEDYSQALWDSIKSDPDFDIESFNIFSVLLGEADHQKVASSLAANLSGAGAHKLSANVSRKIKDLFTSSGASLVSDIYRKALLSLDAAPIAQDLFVFDRKQLVLNYRYILLDLLVEEKDDSRVETVADKLLKEWEKITGERDEAYLKDLSASFGKIKASGRAMLPRLSELEKRLGSFLEGLVWQEEVSPGLAQLVDGIEASFIGADEYFRKMFEEGVMNARALKAFFKFFPDKLDTLYERIKNKRSDIDFVAKILEAMRQSDSQLTLPVMEMIYSFSGDIIRIEILQIMAKTGIYNREFVFEVLKSRNSFLKKEALAVLSEQRDYQKAMEILFSCPNPWGRNNDMLMENLALVEELQFRQALDYLDYLDRNTSFWNFSLKARIKESMGRLNAGNR